MQDGTVNMHQYWDNIDFEYLTETLKWWLYKCSNNVAKTHKTHGNSQLRKKMAIQLSKCKNSIWPNIQSMELTEASVKFKVDEIGTTGAKKD